MNRHPIRKPALRARLLAIFAVSLFAAASAAAAPTAPCGCHGSMYSVVNLDPEGGAAALLNEQGQAAFGSFVFGTNGFFDGERVRPIGSLGGGFTVVKGLNNRGVVIGESTDASEPAGNDYPFTWTLARGMRALPGSLNGQVWDINERNQIVGQLGAPGITARAVRWDPNGAIVSLGPFPFSLSEGRSINDSALAGGFADYADGSIHATLWDAGGRLRDLGTLGGARAFTLFVNQRGDAAGYSDDPRNENELGFFWSARGGRVPIGSRRPQRPRRSRRHHRWPGCDHGLSVVACARPGAAAARRRARVRCVRHQ
jgi:hypothetical protein